MSKANNIPPWIKKANSHKTKGNRHSKNRKLYASMEWRNLSEETKLNNPQCKMCDTLFYDIKGNLVLDHIIPIEQGGAIWHPANHQVLCNKCHNKKTGFDQNGYNKPVRWITEDGKNKKIPIK